MLEDHLEKLRYFHAISEEGSILSASKLVGISQSALSKSVLVLEDILNKKLLVRHRRGINLTKAGEVLFGYCKKLQTEIPDLEQRIKETESMSGVIRIGTYETLGVSFWPTALQHLSESYPNITISIITSSAQSIWTQLDNGELDLIVDAEPPILEKYFSKTLYIDVFGLYINKKFNKLQRPQPYSFVRRAFDKKGHSINENLVKLGLDFKLNFDFDTFICVEAITKKGLAIGVLPKSLALSGLQSKELLMYPSKKKHIQFGEHQVCMTCLEDRRSDQRLISIFDSLKYVMGRVNA